MFIDEPPDLRAVTIRVQAARSSVAEEPANPVLGRAELPGIVLVVERYGARQYPVEVREEFVDEVVELVPEVLVAEGYEKLVRFCPSASEPIPWTLRKIRTESRASRSRGTSSSSRNVLAPRMSSSS